MHLDFTKHGLTLKVVFQEAFDKVRYGNVKKTLTHSIVRYKISTIINRVEKIPKVI